MAEDTTGFLPNISIDFVIFGIKEGELHFLGYQRKQDDKTMIQPFRHEIHDLDEPPKPASTERPSSNPKRAFSLSKKQWWLYGTATIILLIIGFVIINIEVLEIVIDGFLVDLEALVQAIHAGAFGLVYQHQFAGHPVPGIGQVKDMGLERDVLQVGQHFAFDSARPTNGPPVVGSLP